jgi:hypothetical protein
MAMKKTISTIAFSLIALCASAQFYLGMGGHWAPPMQIDNCCNTFLEVEPLRVLAAGFTIRKRVEDPKGRTWYWEAGVSSLGTGYRTHRFFNEREKAYRFGGLSGRGFPSVLLGAGRAFRISKKSQHHEAMIGGEVSYRIAHDLLSLESHAFGIRSTPDDYTFPFFARLNLGYNYHFSVLRHIPVYLQFYTLLSFQNMAEGSHYIRNPETGESDFSGRFQQNNSQMGIKFFVDLEADNYKLGLDHLKAQKWKGSMKQMPVRFSLEGQLYLPRGTQYYTPLVDSFSLNSFVFVPVGQLSFQTELFNFKNDRWLTLIGLGVGMTQINYDFTGDAAYTADRREFNSKDIHRVGAHLIANLGVAYQQPLLKYRLQHSFSTSWVIPVWQQPLSFFERDRTGSLSPGPPAPGERLLLEGVVDKKYHRNAVVFGLEYRPEIILREDNRFFLALGAVLNYSFGRTAIGRVTIDNGTTQYHGELRQEFSKVGVTARVGWNARRR